MFELSKGQERKPRSPKLLIFLESYGLHHPLQQLNKSRQMKIKDLLNSPDKWIQHCYAKKKNGKLVHPAKPEAYCFCLRGALIQCYANMQEKNVAENKLLKVVAENTLHTGLIAFNDSPETTFEDIRRILEIADV